METGQKRLKIRAKLNSTAKYIKFFNGPYNLTDREIVILAGIIDSGSIIGSPEDRVKASKELNVSGMVLNTYIKRLKDKKALVINDGKYELAKIFERYSEVEILINGEP